jgi:monoamine oxidase
MSLYTIKGGIERLPQEIAKRLKARILLNHAVTRIEKTDSESYVISAKHKANVVEEEFDYVVAALPNNWIPAIEWAGEKLERAMQRHHAQYDHPGHYLRVSVLFDKPFWRHRIRESYFMIDAFGGCCVYDESSRSDVDAEGVLGWLLAGEAAETMSNFDDETLIAKVLESLPPELGNPHASFKEARVHRWVGAVNGLPGGKTAREPMSRHRPEPTQHSRLFVVGDYLFDSTLNGVLDSAELVSDLIEADILGNNLAAPAYVDSVAVSTSGHLTGVAASCTTGLPTT